MKKRILSVLITVVMLIGMLPTAVFAAETAEAKWAFGTAETAPDDSAYTYSGTLAEAFTAANGNEDTTNTVTYVKLNKDVSMTHTSSATALTLNEGKAMVLDLNSKTYSSLTTSTSGGDATYGIKTEPNGLLTVKNGTISVSSSNDGYATATTNQMQYAAAIYAYEGNITIENSTVTANAPHANAVYSYWSDLRYTIKNSNVTISAAKMGIGLTVGTRLFVENSTVEVTSDAGLAIVNDQNNFGAVPRFTGTHVVYAGDDAGSATEADASADATYANKYVKIEPVCTVTVNYGIDGVNNKEIAVTKGDTISLENPVIDGYLFMGWFTDDTYQTPFDPTAPITESITVYAKFTAAVAKIENTGTSGLVDTYTITYTDGTTTTFTVTNGEKGDKGDQGIQGIQGVPGADGHTPVITIQNGYWYIEGVNTNQAAQGVKGDKGDKGDTGATGATGAQGPQGDKGDTGATGNGIASITTSKANGITTVTIKFTDPNMADVIFTIEDGTDGAKGDKGDTGAQGPQGEKGDKGDTGAQGEKGDKGNTGAAGADGVGIANIEKTSSDGNVDTYTITLTNGTTYTFTVTNGTNGTDGKDGKDGTNGKDGVDGKDGTNGTNGVDGKDGANGTDGQTPYIGENGNWWIGDTDTGVKAAGDDGKDGAIIVATAVGGTALISNIALIAWTLIKKKRLF